MGRQYNGFRVRDIPGTGAGVQTGAADVPPAPVPPPGEKAIAAQIKMIWGLAKKIGLDKEALAEKCLAIAGKEHISTLTRGDAGRLIDALLGKPVYPRMRPSWDTDPDGRPFNRASQKQINYILAIAHQMGWIVNGDRTRLLAFLRGRYQVTFPDWLAPDQANDVIQALKAMAAGGRGERKGRGDAE